MWESLGFDADERVEHVKNHQMLGEFRKALFSRVVPNVKKIGLWGRKVQEAFVDMGVMMFEHMDPDESFARDESIAEELDRLMAQGRHKEIRFMWESDAEQVAETIAVGMSATEAGE